MLRMHTEGSTLQEIANAFGYSSPSTAWGKIRRVLDEQKSWSVDEYRKIQDLQIDALTEKAIEHITSEDADTSLKGMVVMTKLLERRAKLHGLDAAQAVHIQGEMVSITPEAQARIEEARERLQAITQSSGTPALRAVEPA